MRAREIPIGELPEFFKHFSQTHRFECVSIETTDPDGRTASTARSLPLMGVLTELPANGRGGIDVTILAGTALDAQVAHTVHLPTRVAIVDWRDRLAASLEITDADGCTTMLHLDPVPHEAAKSK
jgi:hypothetical protein